MRSGHNPLRGQQAQPMPKIVVCAITHLPNVGGKYADGYHANRLEIVQLCLKTMRERAGMEVATCVWDKVATTRVSSSRTTRRSRARSIAKYGRPAA